MSKKGLYTNSELIQSVICDLNNLLKEQAGGQYINACAIVTSISAKLVSLKSSIDNDLKNRDETIETLKEQLRQHGVEVVEVSAEDLREDKA